MKKLIFAFILAGSLAGCASNPQQANLTARLAVTYAVAKGGEQGWDLNEVRRIATLGRDIATGEAATVGALKELALQQLGKLNLSPADRALANVLVDAVMIEIEARVGPGGIIDPDRAVRVVEVLQWVIDATGPAP